MKREPYRRITPTALARNAPPQSGLRPASSTFLGGCQKSMSLRTSDRRHWCGSPPVGWKQLGFAAKMFGNPRDCARRKYPWGTTPACALVRNDRAFSNSPLTPFAARRTARRGSFFSYYCRLVMLSLDFHFFFHILFPHSFSTFFSKPVKKNPYATKVLLFYVLVSHANPKNSTGLSLSVEFFPSIPFLKRFQPPSLAFENQLFSRISRNFSTGYSYIVETFLQQGMGCGKQERGRAPGFSRVSAPMRLIFCFFHRLQPVFHMIYPQLWKQLWINLRICSLQVSVFYLLCR